MKWLPLNTVCLNILYRKLTKLDNQEKQFLFHLYSKFSSVLVQSGQINLFSSTGIYVHVHVIIANVLNQNSIIIEYVTSFPFWFYCTNCQFL